MANTIETITTPLGTFELFDNGNNYLHPSRNYEPGLKKAVIGTIFEKDGRKGIRLHDEIIVPPYYDEIGIVSNPDRIYLIKGGRYDYFGESWEIGGYYEKDSHFIFRDRKMGWERDGKIVVEPKYDNVEEFGFRIYETRNRSNIKYLNEDGTEVLTFRREIDEEYESPFWLRSNDGDAFTILECPPIPNLPKSNVLKCSDGKRVGIDRFNRNVILKELINKNDEIYLTNKKLDGLTNEFSYEFSAYRFTVKGDHPIHQLIDLIKYFGVNNNTWFYVIRLTTPTGEQIQADELLLLPKFLDSNRNEALGKTIGIGHDDSLQPGEVSALILTHYNECCFPPYERMDWIDVCKKGTLEEVKEKEKELQSYIMNDIVEESQEDFLQDSYDTIFTNIIFNPYKERSWEETEKVLDYIATKSDRYKSKVWKTVEEITNSDAWYDRDLSLNFLDWILRKGADANQIRSGMTPIDYISKVMQEDQRKADTTMFELRNTFIRYGGLTYEKYRAAYLQDHSEYEFALKVLSGE